MFERYTEGARRTIFLSRYEAAQFGSPLIETEHLLLGLFRESKSTLDFVLKHHNSEKDLHAAILAIAPQHGKKSTREDLKLSNECKRILAYAAEEASLLHDKHIGVDHLLIGMLREEKSFATQFLGERGIEYENVRAILAASRPDPRDSDQHAASAKRYELKRTASPDRPMTGSAAPLPKPGLLSRFLRRLRVSK